MMSKLPTERERQRGRDAYKKRLEREGTEVVRKQGREASKEQYWADPDKARSRVQQRKADGLAGNRVKTLRTQPWATKEQRREVRRFYQACPPDMSVDHIIPIVHHLLAGLHVIGNLQYLTPAGNISKGNKFECTMEEAEAYVRAGLAVWAKDVGPDGVVDWAQYADNDEKRDVLRALDAYGIHRADRTFLRLRIFRGLPRPQCYVGGRAATGGPVQDINFHTDVGSPGIWESLLIPCGLDALRHVPRPSWIDSWILTKFRTEIRPGRSSEPLKYNNAQPGGPG
jgi:5-methylcytosine-specific restriction endonuclease McrA